jgi:hypothetical protein
LIDIARISLYFAVEINDAALRPCYPRCELLAGPDALSSRRHFARFLQTTTHFGQAAEVASDPREDLLNYSERACLVVAVGEG